MRAKTVHAASPEMFSSALNQSVSDGFTPTLAILFISIKQNRREVCRLLQEKEIDIFGATSCGEFTEGYQAEGSIVCLLLDIAREHYALYVDDTAEKSVPEAGFLLAKKALQKFNNPALILCTTGVNARAEFFDGMGLEHHLKEALGPERVFFGGMAGDDMTLSGSYVFTHDKESGQGLAAVLLDGDKINLKGMALTGWKRMGISRTVTKGNGNRIYEIDNKPAVAMYFQYLGKEGQSGQVSFNLMNEVSLHYPFIVERPGGGTFLHTPLQIDEKENALLTDVAMPEGTKFWFSVPPDFDIVDEVLQEASAVQNGNRADALLVFSCAGRINVLGPLVQSENEGLHEIWQAPMAGFFTYGEFGRDEKNKQEFHSGACCWVALKEI